MVAGIARITLTGDADDWYRAEPPRGARADRVRRGAGAQRSAVRHGIRLRAPTCWNSRRAMARGSSTGRDAIRDNNEKLAIAQFPQLTAPTLVTQRRCAHTRIPPRAPDIIFKPLDGMGGAGIFRVREDGMNLGSIIETLSDNGTAHHHGPALHSRDRRGRQAGAADRRRSRCRYGLARIPQGGEVRGNLAAGGLGVARRSPPRDREIGETVAPILWQRGPAAGGTGRDRRLPDRNQCHQPDLLPGNRPSRPVSPSRRCSSMRWNAPQPWFNAGFPSPIKTLWLVSCS